MIRRPDIIIAIDPDVDKSGFAMIDIETKDYEVNSFQIPLLICRLNDAQNIAAASGYSLIVVVEASWKSTFNWHTEKVTSKAAIAKTGYNVGRNHQVGMTIVEICRSLGIDVKEKAPLKKCWKGPGGKITHDEMLQIAGKIPGRTSQEMRDALLLAWSEAGLPMRVKV